MKIYAQENGSYTKGELVELATMLIKGGYTVKRGRMKNPDGKGYIEYVEFEGDALADGDTDGKA